MHTKYRLVALALAAATNLAILLVVQVNAQASNVRPVAGPVSGTSGCWRRTCPTCSGYEMAGFDPSRMLARPPRPKRAAIKKTVIRRQVVRKSKPRAKAPAKTLKSLLPPLKPQRPVFARSTVRAKARKTVIPSPGPKRISVKYTRFLDCEELRLKTQELLNEKRIDDADRLLKEAIEADPTDRCPRLLSIDLNLCRARSFFACQEYECASRMLREALFLDPTHWQATSMLESCYKATGVNPLDAATRLQVAQYLEKNNRTAGAMVEYRAAIANGAGSAGHAGLANIALKLDQKQLALSEFQKTVQLDPTNADAFRQLGFLKKHFGDKSGATAAFEQALRLRPDDPIAGEALSALNPGRALDRFQPLTQAPQIAPLAAPAPANDPLAQFLQEGPKPVNYTSSPFDPAKLFAASKSCNCH